MTLQRRPGRRPIKYEVTLADLGISKGFIVWLVMFVATCVAGGIAMAVLNGHRRTATPTSTIASPETTALTTSTTPATTNYTTITTTTRNITTTTAEAGKCPGTNNSIESNTPRLINTNGEVSTRFDFNGQEVYRSCGVTYENSFYIYGGDSNARQVLQLDNCGLTPIGSLPFDHRWGTCDALNGVIVLCFDQDDPKQCWSSKELLGPWCEMTPSYFDHGVTAIATSPHGFLAVGSGPARHTEAELFDFETDNWTVVSSYPFSGNNLDSFAMLYIRDLSAYFVIGGNGNNKNGLRTIAEFKNGVWREAGQLLTMHNGLDAEWTNGNLIVAGGSGWGLRSETCTMNKSGKFTCHNISPELTNYYYGVSFLVPSNVCV